MRIPLLLLLAVLISPVTARRAIQLDVKAEWPMHAADLTTEIGEFVSDVSPDLYWTFVHQCCQPDGRSVPAGERALTSAHSLLLSDAHSLLETSVGLGTYAPAVHFFDSLSADYGMPCHGEAFAVAFPGNVVHCVHNVSGDSGALSFDDTGRLDVSGGAEAPWDHNFPSVEGASRHVVLYGQIGSASFCELHTALSSRAEAGQFRYSVRPTAVGSPALAGSRTLQGYGVHLDIKNMEYKNLDDSNKASSGDAAAGETRFPDHDVKGINFHKLHERMPGDAGALSRAHEAFVRIEQEEVARGGAVSSADTMKAWKIADLGYQTVLDIVTAEDPAWRMEQLLHNFPSQANSLSNLKVVPEAKQVLSDLHISGIANTLPFNSILVNGVSMDLSAATFGVYDLLDNIKDEYKRQAALNGLGLSSRAMTVLRDAAVKVSSKLASGRPASQSQGMPPDLSSIVRVDVSKGGKNVVQFMNNLEKDSMYANGGFSRSVRTLLQPSWQLHMIAKNLYTLVAVVDLTTPNGRGLLSTLRSIHQRQYPIRIGLVFAPSQNDEAPLVNRNEDMPVTATDILRLFEIAKSSADLPTALELIYELSGQLQEAFLSSFEDSGEYILSLDGTYTKNPAFYGLSRHQLTRGDIVQMAANFLRWTEDELFDALTGPPSTDSDLVGETRSYLQQRGLPIDSFSFNGIVIESSGVEEQLMSLLGREQYFLSQMVQKGLVSDKTRSIFNAVLKSGKMYSRYHPILNEEQPVFVSPLDSPLILLAQSAVYLRNRAVPPQDRTSIVAVTASDTVAVLFSLTQTGLQSAAAAIEWLLSDNSTESTHGVRLALEPLLSDAPTELEIAVVSTLNILVEAVGILDETAALQCVSMFLQAIDATSAGSMTTAVAAFLARRSELLMSVELDMTLDSFAARVANTVPQTDAILARQKFLRAVIKSIEIIPSESYGSDERQQAGARTCSSDTKACNKGVFVLHSGRVLKLKDDYPLHALDLQMLGELVTESVSDIVRDALDKVVIQDIMPAGDGEALLNAVDTLFLSMSAYCGSNAASGPARVDVKGLLASNGFYQKSISGVTKYFRHLKGDAAAYVAAADLFSVELSPPGVSEGSNLGRVFITIVVNPLSQSGQRAAAMMRLCLDHLQLAVHLILIPPFEVTEFPIKNYYRFVASPTLNVGVDPVDATSASSLAVASFRQMPRSQIFTVRMDVPEAWNVQATHSPQDIDNLVCDSRSCGDAASSDTSYVTYTLKNLLVAGQCFELSRSVSPPNGLQLTLDSVSKSNQNLFPDNKLVVRDSRVHSDTLVMQNLGYFQLQADAGMYFLRLAEGKARALFAMETEAPLFGATLPTSVAVEEDESDDDDDKEDSSSKILVYKPSVGPPVGIQVPVKSFSETTLQLKVRKLPGMENIPLLDDPDSKPKKSSVRHKKKPVEEGGVVDSMWNSISNMFGGQSTTPPGSNETIHVFSLATGHVYERLLRIMMLSVSKRTKSPLKFWLFENYLSPTFKLLASEMAFKYGFEIGYVTYKWPKWLTEQTNKQRIIWGYKILFLDVLFPLNVKKVIYVDADQTVRADLKELWDMDLHGKPYGYVPFCSSRKETLGYQFWRSGYWENHLAGKPYHISALYVVDLTVFRRYAVGDRLRAVYDQLARDPNSLANLDQDLPNFAQHTVPIHSLPQEWLWCETWCSDKSKKDAKTIDLCNNPDKKEPKLDMARRIISGPLFKESWMELDEEVRALEISSGVRTVRAD